MKRTGHLQQYRVALGLLLMLFCTRADAQSLVPGMDAVVTMYAPETSQPVAAVKRIGDPLGAGAPFNTNWTPPAIVPAITTWTPATMGQVFGTTIDATGNVYFAATAGYYGGMYPSMTSLIAPVVAPASIGLNGFKGIGSANEIGLVYQADNANLNTVNAIVTAENSGAPTVAGVSSGVGTKKIPNTGYGIGNIAFSATYSRLYATNLEDGKIYAIIQSSGATNGQIDDVFDPFTADNGVSGIAPQGERLFAVGVNNEFDGATRVYYSVLKSAGSAGSVNEIWSVELTANGKFVPATNSLEIQVPVNLNNSYGGTYVSDLAFSVRGEMLVAEKGDPHSAHVYQYYGRHNAWSVAEDQYVSDFSINRNSGGGVDYGFVAGRQGATVCDSLIWTMQNAWGGVRWYGLQSIPHTGYTGPVSSYPSQAYIVDLDGYPNGDPFNYVQKGRFGDVVFYDGRCEGTGPTDICKQVTVTAVKDPEGCCYNIYVSNKYHAGYFTGLEITTGSLNMDNVTAGDTWGGITYKSANHVVFGDSSKLWYMPQDSSSAGAGFFLAKICLSGSGADQFQVALIGNAPQYDTVCLKEIDIRGCDIPVDTNCVGVLNQQAVCKDGVVSLEFQIRNNSNFTMRALTFYNQNPNIKVKSSFFPIADLAPGATSPVYSIPLIVNNNDSVGCFFIAACDINVFPGTSGQYPKFCCMDSIAYCVTIPECDGCDAMAIKATQEEGEDCCFKMELTNNSNHRIQCIRFRGQGGTQFAVFSGWNIQAPVSSNDITICAPGNGIGTGTFPGFASFCLTGTSTAPHAISVELLDAEGHIICVRNLEFPDCELVAPTCANIVNDSMYCEGTQTQLSFYIQNNSPFPLHQVDLRLSDTTFILDKYLILPQPAIAPGATAGPYTINIDHEHATEETFCLYLTGHNNVYIPDSIAATQCCTDSLAVICLPFLHCNDTTGCCVWEDMVIPNGITPNQDGINDFLVIEHGGKCKEIAITVFNRWGNIVYKNSNYANDWGGTNQNGKLLPQGTYYMVIELTSGAKKAMYVDVRY